MPFEWTSPEENEKKLDAIKKWLVVEDWFARHQMTTEYFSLDVAPLIHCRLSASKDEDDGQSHEYVHVHNGCIACVFWRPQQFCVATSKSTES
jgi:hypothetical protein